MKLLRYVMFVVGMIVVQTNVAKVSPLDSETDVVQTNVAQVSSPYSKADVVQTNFAQVSAPHFEIDFHTLISRAKLAVVLFINFDLIPTDQAHASQARMLVEQLKDLQADFIDLSHKRDFALVTFIEVDVTSLPYVADEYGIGNKDVSTIMLFKDGRPFKRNGEIIKRVGIVSQDDFEAWLEEYFEDFITKLKVFIRDKTEVPPVTHYTYEPYSMHYYTRPLFSGNWYRSYWQRPYYERYRERPYSWRHDGYGMQVPGGAHGE